MGRFLLMMLSLIISPALAVGADPATGAANQKRVALVVGNGTYERINDQLKNPPNDAKAIAANLRALDVEVIQAIDLDYRGMRDALRRFDRALQDADAGLFYYAGHGMEYQGRNYLFPTDAVLETEGDVGLGLIDIGQVLQVMETSVPTRLVFLDACRNNPLARSFRKSLGASRSANVGRGLGRIDAAVGTFIAYATAPGEVAADGEGVNSPFTDAMLQHLNEPGLEISQLMHKVRNSVIEATDETQIPWESSSLRGPFILNLNVMINPAPVVSPSTAIDEAQRTETVFWESIKDSDELTSFEAYLERFGENGVFAPLAQTRIKALKSQQTAAIEAAIDFDRRQVQEALSALGYRAGAADGIFGPQTRQAIKAWQEENGDLATAFLSREQAFSILKEAEIEPKPSTSSSASILKRREPVEEGSNHLKAAERYRDSCENGKIEDCNNLGVIYEKGAGVDQDFAQAAILYRKACDGGHARACSNLGYTYEKGYGVDQDFAQAVALYRKACDGKNAVGCSNLGYFYAEGVSVQKDVKKAAALFRKSCNGGFAKGCTRLANLSKN